MLTYLSPLFPSGRKEAQVPYRLSRKEVACNELGDDVQAYWEVFSEVIMRSTTRQTRTDDRARCRGDDAASRQEEEGDDQAEEQTPNGQLHGVEDDDIDGSHQHAAAHPGIPRVRNALVRSLHHLHVDVRFRLLD